MKFYTARRVVLFLFVASCCSVVHGEGSSGALPKDADAEQRRREKILLCNASRMFIMWNVTFKALQKRAMKANTTITTILENFGRYKSIDAFRAKAEEAISGVREAVSNTTAALVTARDFMNGIERDFFNAFEAIKSEPHIYTFGYSNLHLENEDKRVSEVLRLFDNFTVFFAECEGTTDGYETISSMELKVMQVVDNTTDLTNWESEREWRWNETLSHVGSWLQSMKNHTVSAKPNIWSYNGTIKNITMMDCETILGRPEPKSGVTNLLESAYNNMFRHLHDITNGTVRSSIKENGCNISYQEFLSTVTEMAPEGNNKSKDEVNKLCQKLKNITVKENCTTAKTSIEWVNSRFKTAVPKMITYLNQTLKYLSFVETVVKNATRAIIKDAGESICNMSRQLTEVRAHFNGLNALETNKFATANVSSVMNTTGKVKILPEVLKNSETALNITLNANISSEKFPKTCDAAKEFNANVNSAAQMALDSKKKAEEITDTIQAAQCRLQQQHSEVQNSLQKDSDRLLWLANNFTSAISATNKVVESAFDSTGVCDGKAFIVPNMTFYSAAEIVEKLNGIGPDNFVDNGKKCFEESQNGVNSLRSLIGQVNSNCSEAQEVAAEVARSIVSAEQKTRENQRIALQTVLKEMEERKEMLCSTQTQLSKFSSQSMLVSQRRIELQLNISGTTLKLTNAVIGVSKEVAKCTKNTGITVKANHISPAAPQIVSKMQIVNTSCATAFEKVVAENGQALEETELGERLLKESMQAQRNVEALLERKSQQHKEARDAFSSLLKWDDNQVSGLPREMCDGLNLTQHVTFENMEQAAKKLRSISVVDLAKVKQNIEALNSLVLQAEDNITEASKRAVDCEEGARKASRDAEETEKQAQAVLKEVLEKQRSELCDVMTRLGEINRNTSLLMQQAQNAVENATAERLRAEWSSEAAREAADRSASATVYASEAVKMRKETGEAVRATRRGTRILVRSGMTVLSMNEKQIHKINGTLASAFHNVTKEKSRTPLIPCDTQFEFNVTEDLTGALGATERLASLTNTSYALAALNALQQSGRQVVRLARQAKESADAAEQASKAAQKAAEDSKCTPLYLQLFHVLGHDG
ncbi:hypothetical protein TRVL_03655 [Trypanosoma vivax]|nr:hypothetical protein TRVL_03655 [Trypanosoma vivax]